jgi:alkanesulfonate monooxygenase SsuD/methylene tetrahydromethanopterin reductase-like flavin-dependent oxidoreductase (luciferase family)
MVAIIGGEHHRFRPLIDLYREAGTRAGHAAETLKVGIHSLGFPGETDAWAADTYYPGYAKMFTEIGKERGWPPVTRGQYEALRGPTGALLVGDAERVVEKVLRVNDSLGGVDRMTFQMTSPAIPHGEMLKAIEVLGRKVAPMVRKALGD